ncbi:hypothetical protein [Candidatus Leptofilum sp.]|uniref:hypothetical protein n=1 Tax=Candidatus Leptofilum sp. TaxID=3241576 RepID=UPI003B5A00B1
MNFQLLTQILFRHFNRNELFELCLILLIPIKRSKEPKIGLVLKIIEYCEDEGLHKELIAYVILYRSFLSEMLAPYLCDCTKNFPNAEYFARELRNYHTKNMNSYIRLFSSQEEARRTLKQQKKTRVFLSEFALPIDFQGSSPDYIFHY